MMDRSQLTVDTPAKIVVLGAGPIGIEAALYARFLGYDVDVYEKGVVAQNVRHWGHVQMFSPFGMNRSTLGQAAIIAQFPNSSLPPDDAILTGREWSEVYLKPLSQTDLIAESFRENRKVHSVGRPGLLKADHVGKARRAVVPFRIFTQDSDGSEYFTQADIVIDATGTYGNANWVGQGGIPAAGELAHAQCMEYRIPDILGNDRTDFAGKHTLLVGAGYSAATSAVTLAVLANEHAGTHCTWTTRQATSRDKPGPLSTIQDDRLPERDALVRRANALVADGSLTHWPATHVESIELASSRNQFQVRFIGDHACEHFFDRVIANVGYHPDTSLYRELQVHECYATEGPFKLAAQLMGTLGTDCLDQASNGPEELINPEPHYYILGSKSYGRNSHFLYRLGLQQIRDLFSMISGRESLDLYKTLAKTSHAT